MSNSPPSRRALAAASILVYAAVFFAFYRWERLGLGIGHFYYVAIALAALAGDVVVGALAGLLATGLYAGGILLSPHLPSAEAPSHPTLLRGVTYIAMGALIGWFASNHRIMLNELRVVAGRDVLTGLPNSRTFETAITRHLESRRRFGLLIGDLDSLESVNRGAGGRHDGDRALRAVAEALTASLRPGEEVARIGGDEFAVLTTRSEQDARSTSTHFERVLAGVGLPTTFGWSTYPEDGDNALSLYRAADERLYARKLFRGQRRGGRSGGVRDAAVDLTTA
ncbi:MAG: hypothetical protein QOE36_3538 [Gaiellaceae bacterium]|jgi:diguanylate cyclase (GGDEF)-like protein|nr:hypothetical protein [Gaiellaceae bacterium]